MSRERTEFGIAELRQMRIGDRSAEWDGWPPEVRPRKSLASLGKAALVLLLLLFFADESRTAGWRSTCHEQRGLTCIDGVELTTLLSADARDRGERP